MYLYSVANFLFHVSNIAFTSLFNFSKFNLHFCEALSTPSKPWRSYSNVLRTLLTSLKIDFIRFHEISLSHACACAPNLAFQRSLQRIRNDSISLHSATHHRLFVTPTFKKLRWSTQQHRISQAVRPPVPVAGFAVSWRGLEGQALDSWYQKPEAKSTENTWTKTEKCLKCEANLFSCAVWWGFIEANKALMICQSRGSSSQSKTVHGLRRV